MVRIVKVFLGFLFILCVFIVGLLLGRRTSGQTIRRDVIATVGDHSFYRGDLNLELKLFERRALELLCYEYVIKSEADKRNLRAKSKASDSTLSGIEGRIQDLLLQLAVQGLPESYFERIYGAFSAELKRYDLDAAFFLSQSALTAFQRELPGDFATLRQKHGTQVPGEIAWNGLTLRAVLGSLGADAKSKLEPLKDGELSQPIAFQGGFLVLRVVKVHDTYAELRPEILAMVGSSRQLLVLDSLLSRNQVVTQIPIGRLYRPAEPLEKVETGPEILPAPVATPGTAVPTPAKFDPTLDPAGPGIPKPTATGAAPILLPEPTRSGTPNTSEEPPK